MKKQKNGSSIEKEPAVTPKRKTKKPLSQERKDRADTIITQLMDTIPVEILTDAEVLKEYRDRVEKVPTSMLDDRGLQIAQRAHSIVEADNARAVSKSADATREAGNRALADLATKRAGIIFLKQRIADHVKATKQGKILNYPSKIVFSCGSVEFELNFEEIKDATPNNNATIDEIAKYVQFVLDGAIKSTQSKTSQITKKFLLGDVPLDGYHTIVRKLVADHKEE
jgi:hypothetical protein